MIGRPMMERASWIRETETRRRSTRRKLGGGQRERTGSRSGNRAAGRAHDLLGQPGNWVNESVNTTNSTFGASDRRERGATKARCGQPYSASVDATDSNCGAPQEERRRENKLMAWATRR
jgi:hypothetical protein